MFDIIRMRDGLRRATGQDTTELPDDLTDLFLNQAYWELIDKFPFREKEVKGPFTTTPHIRSYNVPSPFEALRGLAFVNPDTEQHTPLDQISFDVYEQLYDESTEAETIPTKYVRDGCQVILWPTPNASYTIIMRYWTVLADLGNNQNPNIPQSWHELIYYGGLARAFMDIGDIVRGNYFNNFQSSKINTQIPVEAKEEVDFHRAGLSVQGQDRDYLG